MRGRCFRLLLGLTGVMIASHPVLRGYCASPTNRPAPARVSFELYRDYMIVVQGSAGPLKGLNFLFDTGAPPSVLSPRVAGKLHIEAAPVGIAVLNGNAQGGMSTVSSLQFGPILKKNVPVLIEDLSFVQQWLPVQIDGIVGLDVLGQGSFVIDYVSRELRFGPTVAMPLSTQLHMKAGLPIINATVNHSTVQLLLDTGAPSLVLFEQMPDTALGLQAALRERSASSIGSLDGKLEQRIDLKLGGVEFGNAPAFMVRNRRDAGHNFDGVVSAAALGITKVAVDISQGTLEFTR